MGMLPPTWQLLCLCLLDGSVGGAEPGKAEGLPLELLVDLVGVLLVALGLEVFELALWE